MHYLSKLLPLDQNQTHNSNLFLLKSRTVSVKMGFFGDDIEYPSKSFLGFGYSV